MNLTRSDRRVAGAVVLVASALLAGCGGGGHQDGASVPGSRAGQPPAGVSGAAPVPPTQGPPPSKAGRTPAGGAAPGPRATPPTDAGSAVDPARAPATLTARGNRISPSSVQVPPYIAVQLTLVSADRARHTLRVAGKALTAGGSGPQSAQLTLDGLRPGASYVATSVESGQTIRIEPSAEPGP